MLSSGNEDGYMSAGGSGGVSFETVAHHASLRTRTAAVTCHSRKHLLLIGAHYIHIIFS